MISTPSSLLGAKQIFILWRAVAVSQLLNLLWSLLTVCVLIFHAFRYKAGGAHALRLCGKLLATMSFIKISDKEWLNINAVRSYKVQTRTHEIEHRQDLGGGMSQVTGKTEQEEAILVLTLMDGKEIRLREPLSVEGLAALVR
jgi:hypothetical protein